MTPRCDLMVSVLIDSPRPKPPFFVVKNGSNIRCKSLGGMAGPRSLIDTSTSSLISLVTMLSVRSANSQTQAAWGTLINGTNGLQNFEQAGNANWRVMEDGIGASVGNGFLVTKESYKDFRIVAEIWTDERANSGIFIRCQDPEDPGADSCYEVNMFDTRPGQEYATGCIFNTAPVIGGPHKAAASGTPSRSLPRDLSLPLCSTAWRRRKQPTPNTARVASRCNTVRAR